nr:hypothetical protein B0A51_10035 [Rachicladosporium sp. CCFEE 5018]
MARTKQTARKSTRGRKPRQTLADQIKRREAKRLKTPEPPSEESILESYLAAERKATISADAKLDRDVPETKPVTSTTILNKDAVDGMRNTSWRTAELGYSVSILNYLETMDRDIYEEDVPWTRYPPTSPSMSTLTMTDECEDRFWEQEDRIKKITRFVMECAAYLATPKLMQILDAEVIAQAISRDIAKQVQHYGRGTRPYRNDLQGHFHYIYRMRQIARPRALDFALEAMERYSVLCCFHAKTWLSEHMDFECGASDDLYAMLITTKAGWDAEWDVSDTVHALLEKRKKLASIGADLNYFTRHFRMQARSKVSGHMILSSWRDRTMSLSA